MSAVVWHSLVCFWTWPRACAGYTCARYKQETAISISDWHSFEETVWVCQNWILKPVLWLVSQSQIYGGYFILIDHVTSLVPYKDFRTSMFGAQETFKVKKPQKKVSTDLLLSLCLLYDRPACLIEREWHRALKYFIKVPKVKYRLHLKTNSSKLGFEY